MQADNPWCVNTDHILSLVTIIYYSSFVEVILTFFFTKLNENVIVSLAVVTRQRRARSSKVGVALLAPPDTLYLLIYAVLPRRFKNTLHTALQSATRKSLYI